MDNTSKTDTELLAALGLKPLSIHGDALNLLVDEYMSACSVEDSPAEHGLEYKLECLAKEANLTLEGLLETVE